MFAKITSGPPAPSGFDTDKEALIFDKLAGIAEAVRDDGSALALETCLYILGAQTALATITTAQNLFNKTLPSGVLNKVGRTFKVTGQLIYTSPGTSTATLTIALVIGGVTVCTITTAATSGTASTNMPVSFEFLVTVVTTGGTGTVEAHGQVNANISANTPAAAVATYLDTNTAVSSAINMIGGVVALVTIAASATITSAQLRQMVIEILN